MDAKKQRAFSPARKVYRPSLRRYFNFNILSSGVFPSVSFGLLLLVILLSPLFNGHPKQLFVVVPLCLIFLGPIEAFFVFYLLWRTHLRLVISVEGIEYSTVGYRIFTSWDNVAGFGTRQEFFATRGASWTKEIGGLELRQSAPVYKASPLARFLLRQHKLERPSFFIPVSTVVENWQDKLAADIQQYAPQTAMNLNYH
jgi:hypothetical protein